MNLREREGRLMPQPFPFPALSPVSSAHPSQINAVYAVKNQTLTRGLKYSLATGNWGQQGTQGMRAGVSQVWVGKRRLADCESPPDSLTCHSSILLTYARSTLKLGSPHLPPAPPLLPGPQSPHLRVLPVPSPTRQLAHRTRGEAGEAQAAAQQVCTCARGRRGGTT